MAPLTLELLDATVSAKQLMVSAAPDGKEQRAYVQAVVAARAIKTAG